MVDANSHMEQAIPGSDDVLRVTLDNGITILVRESYTSPAVVIDGMMLGGAIWNPDGKQGLSHFVGRMLTRGTRDYSFSELFEEVEGNGASLELSSAYHTFTFGTKSLAEDLPRMLTLLAQVLRYPTFPTDYVERVRGQLLTELQRRSENTRAMASLGMRSLAYPDDHPYALSARGYAETVPTITRDDLVGFHEQMGPDGMVLVIAGGVDAQAAVQAVEDAFGDWSNPNQNGKPEAPDVDKLTEVHERFIPIPAKSQADIALGMIGPRRSAPDYQSARIANSILGVFGLYGRLGDNVREKQGLAYYSFSSMRGGWGQNPWQVIAGVAPENVDAAVSSIRDELRRMRDELVTEDELADNQSYLTGSLVLGLETNDGVANTLLSMEMYDLGLDYLKHYPEQINNVTREDVQQAAQRYLDADAYALAVAGPPQE